MTRKSIVGEKIIFELLTTVNESPEATTTPLIALPAQLQTSVAALPASQPPPSSELTTPQPPVDKSPTQKGDLPNEFPTQLGNAPAIMVNDSGILPSLFDDPDNDDIAPVCAARQLCCAPNSDTKEYPFCFNNKDTLLAIAQIVHPENAFPFPKVVSVWTVKSFPVT